MRIFGSVILVVFCLMLLSCGGGKMASEETSGVDKMKKSEYNKRRANSPVIAIDTDFGTMTLELYRDMAPIHVDSMLARVKEKFYDGLIFHRIIDGFMIQGGDPTGTGAGDAGYNLPAEFTDLEHVEGTLSMARASDPNSASCQFFICLARTPHLDGQYTVFGQLLDGYDTLRKIGKVKTDMRDKPLEDIVMKKVYIIEDVQEE
jgi:cyclophilin family peptidyl-prolyl cis-trans isomerase